jgi:hypothetical protein
MLKSLVERGWRTGYSGGVKSLAHRALSIARRCFLYNGEFQSDQRILVMERSITDTDIHGHADPNVM